MYLCRHGLPLPPPRPLGRARSGACMAVLCGVLFLDGLDVSMVGMALPSIESDLGLTTSQLQWIVSGYVLGYGGFLLLGGRAADLLGRRRVLLVALARLHRRVRARRPRRATARCSSSRASSRAPPPRSPRPPGSRSSRRASPRARAQPGAEHLHRDRRERLLARPGGRRPADRARLALDVPAARCRSRSRCSPRPRACCRATTSRLDRPALVRHPGRRDPDRRDAAARAHDRRGARRGWGSPETSARSRSPRRCWPRSSRSSAATRAPLVRLGILRSGSLVRANLGMMALFGAYVGFQFVMTLYLQAMNGWSPVETALAFLPAGLLVAVGSTADRPARRPLRHGARDRRRRAGLGARLRARAAPRRASRTTRPCCCRRCCCSASASCSASRR